MSVLSVQTTITGLIPNTNGLGIGMTQQLPVQIYIATDNTLAEVLATGFLTKSHTDFQYPYNNYQMAEVYTTDEGCIWLRVAVTVSGGQPVYSLTSPAGSGDVTLPTIANHIAIFTDASGTISKDATTAINGGNVQAGLSGTAGYLASFPTTVAKGSFRVVAADNTGDTLVTVTNAAHGQATVYTIPDVGAATGGLVASTTPFRIKSVVGAAAAGGAAAQSFSDAYCTSASNVIGNWVTQANAASVLKIVPGNGSFVVTSSADAGVGTFSYIITKA